MLKIAPIFDSHMVLQQDKPIAVWGHGKKSEIVDVRLGDAYSRCAVADDGTWLVYLPQFSAGGPWTMTVSSGEEQIVLEDILVGEVWLAGGQSNMEFPLRDDKNADHEIAISDFPQIRYYNVPKRATSFENVTTGCWRICSPETNADLSAVAYYFAKELHLCRDVPVGIITCAWGGTSVSCWISREAMGTTPAGRRYLNRWKELVGDKTDQQYWQEVDTYNREWSAWDRRVQDCRKTDPDISWTELNEKCGLCPWPQPVGNLSPYRPGGLYETMLRPAAPFALRGFLWYQGEEDWERFHAYDQMLELLIGQWRADWKDNQLPFLLVQLPMYCTSEDLRNGWDSCYWAMIRDAQSQVCRKVSHTALAVLTDCGEVDNIHPVDKAPVGHRLALLARGKVYKEDVLCDAPSMEQVSISESSVTVRFRNSGGKLVVKGETLEGFFLSGADGRFQMADGVIDGDTVVLNCDQIKNPRYVRYAWTNYGKANLYSISGLPVAPFRTDDFPVWESDEAKAWRRDSLEAMENNNI